jgi:hypothetical protein
MSQTLHDKIKTWIENYVKLKDAKLEEYTVENFDNLTGERKDPYANIDKHFENNLDDLVSFIKEKNIKTINNNESGVRYKYWRGRPRNENGFIIHKFGNIEQVWSETDALKTRNRGFSKKIVKRIFPCYTDVNDVTTLKWYVFWQKNN